MTRKDYVALAAALHNVQPELDTDGTYQPEGRAAWDACVRAVARVLAADNGRFDRDRFVRVC